MTSIIPLASPTYYPNSTLTKPATHPGVFLLELHARPDNRLTQDFIQSSLLGPLQDIEREYRASLLGLLLAPAVDTTGWKNPLKPGQYALVTCGPRDKNRIYSNGLDLTEALASDHFFQHVLNRLYVKLLRFPIPTVAAINGHAFAGGFCLALAHDYRVMKDNEQKGKAMMAMNEIEFGAPVPLGLMAVLEAKLPTPNSLAKCLLEAHRFSAKESLELGMVHAIVPESEVVETSIQLGFDKSVRAATGVLGMIKESLYRGQINVLNSTDGGNGDVQSIHASRMKQLGNTQTGKSKL